MPFSYTRTLFHLEGTQKKSFPITMIAPTPTPVMHCSSPSTHFSGACAPDQWFVFFYFDCNLVLSRVKLASLFGKRFVQFDMCLLDFPLICSFVPLSNA